MSTNNGNITIDDLIFNLTAGTPITFPAIFSDRQLCGIELDFYVTNNQLVDQIEDIFKRDKVRVSDPFQNREYEGRVFVKSWSYQDNHPGRSYRAEVKELDMPPEVDEIELNGQRFEVLKYSEREDTHGQIGRHALLKLSEEQMNQFLLATKEDIISFVRVNIDTTPLELNLGAMIWWSKHQEDGVNYYKQVVHLYSPNDEKDEDDAIGSAVMLLHTRFQTLQRGIISLYARHETLLRLLAEKGILSDTEYEKLFDDDWKKLLSPERLEELDREFYRVSNAEEFAK